MQSAKKGVFIEGIGRSVVAVADVVAMQSAMRVEALDSVKKIRELSFLGRCVVAVVDVQPATPDFQSRPDRTGREGRRREDGQEGRADEEDEDVRGGSRHLH